MKKRSAFIIAAAALLVGAAAGAFTMRIFEKCFFVINNNSLFEKMRLIGSVADDYFLYGYDKQDYIDGAVKGAVESLDDPYTVYYTKEEFKEFTDSMNGDFVGIGAYVINNEETNEIVIVEPIKGGAAEEAGLVAGDVIYAVNGVKYTGEQLDEAVAAMRGTADGSAEGVVLDVTIKRGEELLEYKLKRKRIHSETVSGKMLDGGIGYIKIDSFNTAEKGEKNTYEEFCDTLEDIKKNTPASLIIDLRNNGGGDADIVSKIADLIVPEGTIMYTEDKKGEREYVKSDPDELELPIALLVNENSASASELLAGALRDHSKAVLVGETTYGKGVVQTLIPFSDGSGMKVTVSRYYTPNGYCVQDEGLVPDYVIDLPEELKNKSISDIAYDDDVQLQKAVEVLLK